MSIESHQLPVRHWWSRNWIACLAAVTVATSFAWKNAVCAPFFLWPRSGEYGWPLPFLVRSVEIHGTLIHLDGTRGREETTYAVADWPAAFVDCFAAIASVIITAVVFSRAQQRCAHWYQISLSTLLALIAMCAILCAIWKLDPGPISVATLFGFLALCGALRAILLLGPRPNT
jgi:hypothetical protein